MEGTLWSILYKTIVTTGGIEGATVFALLVLSVISWTVIIAKLLNLHKARRNNAKFMALFRRADSFGSVATALPSMEGSVLSAVFSACMRAMETLKPATRQPSATSSTTDPRQVRLGPESNPEEMVLLEMRDAAATEITGLSKGLGFLATLGAISPFIGLFGTVWGIMNTFSALGNADSPSLAVVAPGISSALIATAAGLAVAIPAVVAFNLFQARIDGLNDEAEAFMEKLDVILKKNWQPITNAWNEAGVPPDGKEIAGVPKSAPPARTEQATRVAST